MATLKSAAKPDYGKSPESQNELLKKLGEPHVASFNYMINKGMYQAVASILPVEFLVDDQRVKLVISGWSLSEPQVPYGTIGVRTNLIYPSECRQRNGTYNGQLSVTVEWYVDGVPQQPFTKDLGNIPIMVKSNKCNLRNLCPEELVKQGEHEQEWGGYFIVGGLEKFIRMLMMTRRNYPIAIQRSGWKGRGTSFSDLGVSIRCVAQDQTATTNVLHYLTDGTAKFMFSYQKMIYFVPLVLILKCLTNHVDYYIYSQLMEGRQNDLYFDKCCRKMLRVLHLEKLHSHNDCLNYLGSMFRVKLYECPSWYTNQQCAEFLLKNCILIHLNSNEDKFKLLIFMTQKLYSFVQNKCLTEGADAVMMQEVLQGGHLYLQVLKEKMQGWLNGLRLSIEKLAKSNKFNFIQSDMVRASKISGTIESGVKWFMSTGSINSKTGLGLMQDKGLVIVAENINRMRYMSHFRAVHRGSFFLTMRTTEARQMLPDGWGFICPVHTPDGAPCGLLNHLTMDCVITDVPDEEKVKNIPDVMIEIGMWGPGFTRFLKTAEERDCYDVLLDGRHIGLLAQEKAQEVLRHLRHIKIKGERVPNTLEIAFVPLNRTGKGQYPGLFLFTGPSRLMRPVLNLHSKEIELIGSFEQAYLEIAVKKTDVYSGVTTHVDLSELTIMSNVARLIPMPDCNQSPRNMYQCQMGKQTMGTPCHNWDLQSETKLYRLQTPASPLFKPMHYDDIGLDDFAMGTNAIVAVISYTGYDMEDAIIINKASAERGFCHGSIYKSEFVELDDVGSYFALDPSQPHLRESLDNDGFPYIGREFKGGEPLYCYFDADKSDYRVIYFKGKETCFFHSVKLCGDFGSKSKKIACLTFRVPRNPSIGDKFASRAGQKGICSLLMPQEDLPFTESGLVPDIIFNPHGFPSRMTIAMMIELMAGKSGAIQGLIYDATPFKFGEDDTAIDFFGRLLERAGYDYYGTETMYSGTDGRDMQTDIFFGVVHYQRLRHMVADKWQVRSTGPMDISVRQPIKGRKRGGGVRFGEMERDALIAHGASYLLQDRLFNCSDKTSVKICTNCSSTLSPITQATRKTNKPGQMETKVFCTLCKGEDISQIDIPYIYKYVSMHMATLCIDMQLETEKV